MFNSGQIEQILLKKSFYFNLQQVIHLYIRSQVGASYGIKGRIPHLLLSYDLGPPPALLPKNVSDHEPAFRINNIFIQDYMASYIVYGA